MISKILITLGVILACMWMLSARAKPELRQVPNPEHERNRRLLRRASLAFMLVMMIAAGVMIYLERERPDEVVTVHVINTQSGAMKSYRVIRDDVRSDGFTTVDGLQVFVAGIERIEVETR